MTTPTIDFSSIGGKPVGPPPVATGSPSPGGTKIDFSSVGGKPVAGSTPEPAAAAGVPEAAVIPESQRGAAAQAIAPVTGLISLPGHIIHAFNGTPENDREKAFVEHTYQNHGLAPALGLGIYRLIVAPMEREHELAKAYETIANSGQDPVANANEAMSSKELATQQIKTALQQSGGALFGAAGTAMTGPPADTLTARNMSYLHHIASIIPLLGPMGGDVMEHYKQGDPTGAGTEILANIVAGKAIEGVTGKLAKGVRKIAPKTATVAGEEVPVMAGQVKDAAPIAKKVAAEPNPAIEEAQQTAAQQGVKNVATEAANTQLQKMGQPAAASRAESFADAAAQTKAAAKPTFEKLDLLSNGEYDTLKNRFEMASKAERRATTVEDMEAAQKAKTDAQAGIDSLIQKHGSQFKPDELANAQSAWRDMKTMEEIHTHVEKGFSAPESVASKSKLVSRTLDGNKLTTSLNDMVAKIGEENLQRVLGANGLQDLYELGKITSKADKAADASTMGNVIADRLVKAGVGGTIGHAVGGSAGGAVGGALDTARNIFIRSIATNPKVAHFVVTALKAGTPAKVYGPLIANEINRSQ